MKCLAVIIKKVQIAQISEISDKLCNLILNGQNALRDIYSIGLKTLILDVPDKMGAAVSNQLTRKLLSGISQHTTEEVKRECLDNLAELLRRFGSHCEKDHSAIMSAVIDELDSDKQIVRKRSRQCLGSLAVVSSESLLNEMIQKLIDKIYNNEKKAGSSQETRTLIQTIGTISGMVGYRLGRHLDSIIPLFIKFCGDPFEESQQNDASNELREHCFPGLESFVLRCPREVTPFLSEIIKVAVAFMKYDPNYTYDDDCDGDADMDQVRTLRR